jgi:NADH-quinone oxidoreductase E subunit
MTTVSITPMNAQVKSGQTPTPLGLNLKWDKDEESKIKTIRARYPATPQGQQSAVIPLLKIAQDKCGGWLPVDAMELVAKTLDLPYIRVFEVATFYTMFNLKPVGKFHVQVCTNCSCLIRGSDAVVKAVKDIAGVDASGATSQDGTFTFTEVECLGACVDAPMMQVGSHYYTKLDGKKTRAILEHLKKGGDPKKHADTPPGTTDALHGGKYEEHI